MSATMTAQHERRAFRYTDGTDVEVVAEAITEAEAVHLIRTRPARAGELLVAEVVPGRRGLRTVVALTRGGCPSCGRTGR